MPRNPVRTFGEGESEEFPSIAFPAPFASKKRTGQPRERPGVREPRRATDQGPTVAESETSKVFAPVEDPVAPAPAWTAAPRMIPVRRKAMDRFERGPDGRESPGVRAGPIGRTEKGRTVAESKASKVSAPVADPVLPDPATTGLSQDVPGPQRGGPRGGTRKRPHPLKVSAGIGHPEERALILQERCLDESPGAWSEST